MIRRSVAIGFIASAVCSFTLAATSPAFGWGTGVFQRVWAGQCVPTTTGSGYPSAAYFDLTDHGWRQENPGTQTLRCAFPADTETHPHGTISTINVHGYDSESGYEIQAYACVTFWANDNGGSCGSVAGSGIVTTGNYQISPGTGALTTFPQTTDFAYLRVEFPYGSATQSTFRGFSLQ
jgi:hypothetical protein